MTVKNNRRPYLVAVHSFLPKKNAPTNKKGWVRELDKDGKMYMHLIETTHFVDTISSKLNSEAAIIIDILNAKVVKNRLGEDDKVFEDYMKKYEDKIKQAIQNYLIKVGEVR